MSNANGLLKTPTAMPPRRPSVQRVSQSVCLSTLLRRLLLLSCPIENRPSNKAILFQQLTRNTPRAQLPNDLALGPAIPADNGHLGVARVAPDEIADCGLGGIAAQRRLAEREQRLGGEDGRDAEGGGEG